MRTATRPPKQIAFSFSSPNAAEPARPTTRLPGVDGLRAVAALWVVLFHIHAFSEARLAYIPGLDLFLRSGSTGVSLFLVLSGFCLYLPFAGGRAGRFKTREFLLRRCRRLMPAYYVSLVLVVLLDFGLAAWIQPWHLSWPQMAWQILTHATLTHTLFPGTFYSLNGAYWSLGLEWQLYLGMPILIWGILRFGLGKTTAAVLVWNVAYRLALGMAIGHGALARESVLATAVLPNQLPGRWAEFAFGMIAAELYVTRRIAPWASRGKYLLVLFIPLSLLASGWQLSHLIYGCVFFVLLSLVLASNNIVCVVFSWPPLVAIGTMSYSLYLVHQPIVQVLAYVIRVHGHASPAQTFLLLMLFLPMIMLIAWILFATVERRTLVAPRSQAPAEPLTGPQPRNEIRQAFVSSAGRMLRARELRLLKGLLRHTRREAPHTQP